MEEKRDDRRRGNRDPRGAAVEPGVPSPLLSAALGRRARWLPAGLIAAGVVLDLAITPAYTPSAVFAAAPLVAAALLSLRATFGYAVAAVLTLVALLFAVGDLGSAESVTRLVSVAVIAVLALGINVLIRRGNRQLASARDIAEAAQRAVLPTPPARIGAFDIAARYQAAQADARIGGDFYAVQETPFGVRFVVGDVRGKGLDSVEAVAVVLGAFREVAEDEATLEGLAGRLERALRREDGRWLGRDRAEGFVTAVLAEVPRGDPGRLRLVNRGHPPPLLFDGRTARYLEPAVPALPLGLGDLGVWPDRADEQPFPVGAQLLLYTDGLSEARDAEGRFYEPAERLSGRTFAGPEALLDGVLADVTAYAGGGTADDMALLAAARRA